MAGFLYFLPRVLRQDLKRELMLAAGLGDTFRDRLSATHLSGEGRVIVARAIHGPGNTEGTILKPLPLVETPDEAVDVGYYPDRQTWVAVTVDGKLAYWIGYDPQKLPTPDELERDDVISGSLIELGSVPDGPGTFKGQWWEAPVIRLSQHGINLPDVWCLKDGKVASRVKPDWQWAWDLSGQIWDWYQSESSQPREQLYLWACQMLGLNYRMGPEEVGILGLIGKDEFRVVLQTAVNGPLMDRIREGLKKSDAPVIDTPASSTPGSEVSYPATTPVAETSTSPPPVTEPTSP